MLKQYQHAFPMFKEVIKLNNRHVMAFYYAGNFIIFI